jgi:hypothetical protein
MISFCLLTAALATGAVDPPVPAGGCNCGTTQPAVGISYYETSPTPSHPLRDRLRNLFGAPPIASPYQPVTMVQTVPVNAVPVQTAPPPQTLTTVIANRPDYQIPKKYEAKVGHEDDYSWITGHLIYVRVDGGRWVVRYGLLDQEDKFGGSVVLAPTVELRNFREGDLVCIHGEVLDQGRASASLGGALYRVNSINMVERADP